MNSIAARPRHGTGVLAARTLALVALLGILLMGTRDAAATSLIAAHSPGSEVYTTMARSASDHDVVVSRSVGLMEGAATDTSATMLDGSLAGVSRSVGLMDGASGSAGDADLGYSPVEVSRSVGLMSGAAS